MTKPKDYVVRRGEFKDRKARELSAGDLRKLINNIRRTADADAGVDMMGFILDKKGVDGVIEFVEWGQKVLDKTGMILKSDFLPTDGSEPTKEEKQMLRYATPGMTRRNFLLNVAPWCTIAAVGTVHSVAGMIENAIQQPKDAPSPDNKNIFQKTRETIDDKGGYPLELLGSISLAYLAAKDWNDDKFRQISNAIAETGQILGVSERMSSYRLNLPKQAQR